MCAADRDRDREHPHASHCALLGKIAKIASFRVFSKVSRSILWGCLTVERGCKGGAFDSSPGYAGMLGVTGLRGGNTGFFRFSGKNAEFCQKRGSGAVSVFLPFSPEMRFFAKEPERAAFRAFSLFWEKGRISLYFCDNTKIRERNTFSSLLSCLARARQKSRDEMIAIPGGYVACLDFFRTSHKAMYIMTTWGVFYIVMYFFPAALRKYYRPHTSQIFSRNWFVCVCGAA